MDTSLWWFSHAANCTIDVILVKKLGFFYAQFYVLFFCIWLFLLFQECNFLRKKAALTNWPQRIPSANISSKWLCGWEIKGLVCHYAHFGTGIGTLASFPAPHPPPPTPKERAGAHCLLMREIFFITVLCTSLSVQKIIRIQSFLWTRLQRRFNLQNPAGILLFRRGSIIFPNVQPYRKVTNRFTKKGPLVATEYLFPFKHGL